MKSTSVTYIYTASLLIRHWNDLEYV